jgi:hypothetical protein
MTPLPVYNPQESKSNYYRGIHMAEHDIYLLDCCWELGIYCTFKIIFLKIH